MPAIKKRTAEQRLEQLDHYYNELKKCLLGRQMTEGEIRMYYSPGEREREEIEELVWVDDDQLAGAMDHMKTEVDGLKRLKNSAVPTR